MVSHMVINISTQQSEMNILSPLSYR